MIFDVISVADRQNYFMGKYFLSVYIKVLHFIRLQIIKNVFLRYYREPSRPMLAATACKDMRGTILEIGQIFSHGITGVCRVSLFKHL